MTLHPHNSKLLVLILDKFEEMCLVFFFSYVVLLVSSVGSFLLFEVLCMQAAVKEERREARRTKKEIKELYKGEAQHAQRVAAISGPSSIHLM